MLQVIVGPNIYLARKKLHEVRDAFVQEHGDFALEQFDCTEAGYDTVRESLQSMPFLTTHKLVILDTPSALKEYKESHETLLSETPDTTQVVVYEPAPDKRNAYYKFLKKQKLFHEFAAMDEHATAAWLQETAKTKGGAITPSDARYLVDRVGTNQLGLSHELEKLLTYDPQVTRQTIDLLTEASPKTTIFELMEAAFSGQTERALGIYAQQRQLKVEPPQIIAMLAWQLHVLALLATSKGKNDGEIAKAAGISPYVIGKSRGLLRSVGASRLKSLISDLAELDYKSKTSAIDIDRGLQTYIAAIS